MAMAAMAKADPRVAMSLDIKVAFYRSANPGLVVAEGWVERMGGPDLAEGCCERRRAGRSQGMSTIALVSRDR
ncbi:MAG: hypothetical protein R3E53_09275 [Myxococcota bacterium]